MEKIIALLVKPQQITGDLLIKYHLNTKFIIQRNTEKLRYFTQRYIFLSSLLKVKSCVKYLNFSVFLCIINFVFKWYLINKSPVICCGFTNNAIIFSIHYFIYYDEW